MWSTRQSPEQVIARLALLFTLILVGHPLGLAGQGRAWLAPDMRVRFTLRDSAAALPRGGRITTISGDTLLLDVENRPAPLSVAMNAIETLEVSRMHSNSGKGALIGFAVGAFGGGVLAAATAASCHGFCGSGGEAAAAGAILFGAGGAVLGAVIGAATKSGRWETVPFPL